MQDHHDDKFLKDQTYAALLAALPHVNADPVTGKLEPHCFAEVLGEIGGIWPESVLRELMGEEQKKAA